tara:strand:- start:2919 stop:3275 length:357 start_codon:yes stop_codon:yes gene_type:complete
MADRINFQQQINSSVQIGDILYFTLIDANGNANPNPTEVGPIINIGNNFVVVDGLAPTGFTDVDIEGGAIPPLFMFRKNNEANISSLVGYFADVTLSNSNINKVELFNVSSEVFISSK